MDEKKLKKIIKWCSLAPFIITIVGAFISSLSEQDFMGSRMSASDSFILVLLFAVIEFWWIYLFYN